MESISFTQFGINSIYVGDVKGVYDPMFDVFYLYFADINFGIRIFSLDSTTLLSYSGGVSSPEPISEIIISGTNIYTTTYDAKKIQVFEISRKITVDRGFGGYCFVYSCSHFYAQVLCWFL